MKGTPIHMELFGLLWGKIVQDPEPAGFRVTWTPGKGGLRMISFERLRMTRTKVE